MGWAIHGEGETQQIPITDQCSLCPFHGFCYFWLEPILIKRLNKIDFSWNSIIF